MMTQTHTTREIEGEKRYTRKIFSATQLQEKMQFLLFFPAIWFPHFAR